MKREDLIKLGVAEDMVDKIMALHGQDIEKHKTAATTAQTEADGLKTQLAEANKQIEAFKSMDIEGIKRAADDWKAKADQAQKEAAAQMAQLKFDHALDGALSGAKAKNAKAVKALLNMEGLKLNDADGSIIGLKEQLEKIQSENDYLFESDEQTPRIVIGGDHKTVLTDKFTESVYKGAGISLDQGK